MLNRRHIRIKVMQLLYAFKGTESDDLKVQERLLIKSMDSMYNLYLLTLTLLVEVQARAEDVLNKSQQKHLATAEDKNPNRKFTCNELIIALKQNGLLKEVVENRKADNWKLDGEYVDVIYKSLLKSDLYKDYMSTETSSFKQDKEFVIKFFKEIIAPNEKLYDYYEDKNITWVDDYPVVNTAIVKLLNKLKPSSPESLVVPELFRDNEDKDYGIKLLKETILNTTKLNEEVSQKTTNWDKDRIAKIDLTLLRLAICEFQKFPSIPVKVTINEYLDIAKEYSTPKSNVFINGILDKIVKEYDAKGTLNKVGRGLM